MSTHLSQVIADAARSSDWWSVPRAIANFRRNGGSASGMDFWQRSAKLSGRPEHSLRQMCRAYDFIIRHRSRLGNDGLVAALNRPYSFVELIVRIGDIDTDKALALLSDQKSSISVRQLRNELKSSRSDAESDPSELVKGQAERTDAIGFVCQSLADSLAKNHAPVNFVIRERGTPTVSPSAVAVTSTQDGAQLRIGILVTTKSDKMTTYRALAKAGWESTFFDAYWLALALNAEHEMESLIHDYEITNLGLAWFDLATSAFSIAIKPSCHEPWPDRRPLMETGGLHTRPRI